MKNRAIILGIAGASGSGKSLLANTIVEELSSEHVVVISEDSYYRHVPQLSLDERAKQNFDHPASLDHELLSKHLQYLQTGQALEVPIYDFGTHARLPETKRIENYSIVVLEGILLFADKAVRELMDIRIFMDTALDICFIRRLQRDITERSRTLESVIDQYQKTVRPMYLQFIEPSKRYADIIVPRGGENRIAIDLIKAKMKELLNGIPEK